MHRRLFLTMSSLWAGHAGAQAPRRVTLGAENDWAPYSSDVRGQPQGMTVDLVRAAYAAVGIEARFELLPYARCMAQTRAGLLVGCFNTTRNALIEADHLWPAQAMFEERFAIYARTDDAGPTGLGVRELEGQRVAVTRGYEYGAEFDANPRIQRVTTNHDESNFRLVLLQRARYTLCPEVNARLLFQRQPELAGQFKRVGYLPYFGLYTAFSRSHPDAPAMLAAFNEGMRLIQASGQARQIQEQWRRRPDSGARSPLP